MRAYNINITEGDPSNNEYEYLAVIGVYDDGINTKGCYISENTLYKLMEQCKQELLKYDREMHMARCDDCIVDDCIYFGCKELKLLLKEHDKQIKKKDIIDEFKKEMGKLWGGMTPMNDVEAVAAYLKGVIDDTRDN